MCVCVQPQIIEYYRRVLHDCRAWQHLLLCALNITTQGYPVSSSSTIHTGTTYGFPAASTVSVLPCNERYLYGFTATVARRDMSYTHTFPV